MALLLFDIDGTLLAPRGLGKRAFDASLKALYGRVPEATFPYDGLMDVAIAQQTLALLGVDSGDIPVRALLEEYIRRLPSERPSSAQGFLCPGVPGILDEALARGHGLALLTGNLRPTAYLKLGFFELEGYFPCGAFAGDGPLRQDLVPVALARAARLAGRPLGPDEAWIVGDSVHDVRAARAAGVRCAAVCTGNTPEPQLRVEGPDLILGDLASPRELWAAIEGHR